MEPSTALKIGVEFDMKGETGRMYSSQTRFFPSEFEPFQGRTKEGG